MSLVLKYGEDRMMRDWLSWKVVWGAVATALVTASCVVSQAPTLVSVASVVGIMYVVLVAYGHWSANVFGALLGGLFGLLSYQAGFFGNAAVNFLFVIPASLWGIWYWKNHQEDKPRKFNALQWKGYGAIFAALVALGMLFSLYTGANLWYLDGFTAVMPILATFLLVTRYREQWLLWVPYNALEVFMWFWVASAAPEMLAILVMRIVFFFNSLIGASLWYKK